MSKAFVSGEWGSARGAVAAQMQQTYAAQALSSSSGSVSAASAAAGGAASPATSCAAAAFGGIIPTRHFQRSLPRLPVPSLTSSLNRFLTLCVPLMTQEDTKRVKKLAKSFHQHAGRFLQEEITKIDRTNKHTSFVSYDTYEQLLDRRDPVPFARHRVAAAPPDDRQADMLTRAALWVSSSVELYKMYIDNTLRPDCDTGDPRAQHYWQQEWFLRTAALCPEYLSTPFVALGSNRQFTPHDMSQYDNLFNTACLPGVLHDEIRAVGFMPHIIVQYRGHQFSVTVADAECNPLPLEQLYARLRAIVETGVTAAASPVASLTALPRSQWSRARIALLRHTANQESLEEVDTAMFVLNLDDDTQLDFFSRVGCGERRLLGGKPANRWWDKSISVSVGANGLVTVLQDQSWGDKRVLQAYTDAVSQRSYAKARDEADFSKTAAPTEAVTQLRWSLSPEVQQYVSDSCAALEKRAAALRSFSTVVSLPPRYDVGTAPGVLSGHVQLAAQVAWRRLYQTTAPLKEVLDMSAFRRGRECGLYCTTTASQKLTMHAGPCDAALLEEALGEYGQQRARVLAGNGIDNHLFALRCTSLRMYGQLPEFLQSTHVAKVTDALVTVDVANNPARRQALALSAAPPAAGYDVQCTQLSDTHVLLSISSWSDGPQFSPEEYATAMLESLNEMAVATGATCKR